LHDPSKVTPAQVARMNASWGDESWRTVAYQMAPSLFGEVEEKATNEAIAAGFRDRLEAVAGFAYVPDPIPMRNSKGAVVYYLFFASPNKTGASIVRQIFEKYRSKGAH
jgi:three-Cys-motif partner protein